MVWDFDAVRSSYSPVSGNIKGLQNCLAIWYDSYITVFSAGNTYNPFSQQTVEIKIRKMIPWCRNHEESKKKASQALCLWPLLTGPLNICRLLSPLTLNYTDQCCLAHFCPVRSLLITCMLFAQVYNTLLCISLFLLGRVECHLWLWYKNACIIQFQVFDKCLNH